MRKTMTFPKLKPTMRGHCQRCGGAIRFCHAEDDGYWYQCASCGAYQPRRARITHDHEAVAVAKARKASGELSHRQARRRMQKAA